MVLVQHNGDLAIARAEHHFNVQPDQRSKPFFGTRDAADGIDHTLLREVHGMVHDLEQDFILALKVVVKAALAQFECSGYVVHRGGIVAALLEQARSRPQDFLAGIRRCFLGIKCHVKQLSRESQQTEGIEKWVSL